MPLPVVGFFGWFVGLFGTALTSITTWFFARFVYEKAFIYMMITLFLGAVGVLTLGFALGVKAMVMAAQVNFPTTLGPATYFLPSNINQVFAILFAVRISRTVYRWTVSVMAAYAPISPRDRSFIT